MQYRKWCFGMLGFILAVLLFIAGVNYYADIYGYFAFQSGDYADIDFKVGTAETYYRVLKANHILNFGDQYDAYILGGSKTGTYTAEKLKELDGYRYYNLFEFHGTMTEYKTTVDFLLKHTDVKKIIICLGSRESSRLVYDSDSDVMQLPAVMTGKSRIAEYIHFLTFDVTEGLKKIADQIRNGKTVYTENYTDGERNVDNLYASRAKNPDRYVRKKTLEDFQTRLQALFTSPVRDPYYQECLDLAEQIKAECDAAGVELQFWFSPTFVSGLSTIESPYFWNYMRGLAQITDYWDFNGYSDINLNPYNYLDHAHCTYEVAELVVDTVAGKASYPGFGYHVTRDNVDEYLLKREEDYNRLKQEYLETGTIQLQGIDDDSYIPTKDR